MCCHSPLPLLPLSPGTTAALSICNAFILDCLVAGHASLPTPLRSYLPQPLMLLDSEAANRNLKTQEKSIARTVNVPAFSPAKACFSFSGAVVVVFVVVGIPNFTYTRIARTM